MLPAERVLELFETGEISGETPVRVNDSGSPRPLRRYIRELVWSAQASPSEAADSLVQIGFDNAPHGMVFTDLAGQIIRVNQSFAELLGYAPADLVGVSTSQLLAPERLEQESQQANDLLAGRINRSESEKSFRHRDGSLVATLASVAIVRDAMGTPIGAVGHVLDIRELLELREQLARQVRALEDSETRFEELFRHAPQPMLMLSESGIILGSNHQANRLFGCSGPNLAHETLDALLPSWTAAFQSIMSKPITSSMTAEKTVRVTAQRLDGTELRASLGLSRVRLSGGPVLVVGLTDVTAEDAAKAALAVNLREKETLLREIHHRVKNNLQMVSSLLSLQAGSLADPAARELIRECGRRVQSISLIHQQLYGRRSLAEIDFAEFAQELARSQRAAMAPQLRLDLRTEVCQVPIQTALPMGLILNELVTNGIKYGLRKPDDSDRRLGEHEDLRIEVRPSGSDMELIVTDAGPGLPEGFDFRQGKTLGTRLVFSLARQARAQVQFDVDRGTRVIVRCPMARRQETGPPPPP